MKALLVYFVFCTFSLYSQEELFPMKGDFIYYEFKEKTNNTKKCIKKYFTGTSAAADLNLNIIKRTLNLNKFTLGGENPVIEFSPPIFSMDGRDSCLTDVFSDENINIELPTKSTWLKNIFLVSRLNEDKIKVTDQKIYAVVKLKFYSKNEYSLIFTNFKITYFGMKGLTVVNETLNLEDVYKSVKEKGKQDDKLYDRAKESFIELNNIIKEISKIYSEELKRAIQLDEL